jgi:ParB-like chromosome segregation protein Spo0J
MSMKIGNHETHPAADVFPMMEGDEFDSFAASVKKNLRRPIVLHPDGRILDGRNRYAACIKHGVEPLFETWADDGDPVAYVIDANLERRHLNESQRSMIAAKIRELIKAPRGGKRESKKPNDSVKGPIGTLTSADTAAAQLNVGARSVSRAAKVLAEGTPEVVAMVESGELAVSAAAKVVNLPEEQQMPEAKKRARAKGGTGNGKAGGGRGKGKKGNGGGKALPKLTGNTYADIDHFLLAIDDFIEKLYATYPDDRKSINSIIEAHFENYGADHEYRVGP